MSETKIASKAEKYAHLSFWKTAFLANLTFNPLILSTPLDSEMIEQS